MTMNKKTWKLTLAAVFLVSAFGAIALRVAWATPPKGVTNTLLAGPVTVDDIDIVSQTPAHGVMIKTRGNSDTYVAQIRIAPGGDTGWHSHPGPVFALITAGTGSLYFADDPTFTPEVYAAGTGFVEAGGDVHILRNEGDTDLVVVALFLLPQGAPRRIDEPAPPGA
ncbi:MAG: cupin domain-containing protein, partial [Planctomycetota bacterium]